MQTYSSFQPTGFDAKGLHADSLDIGSWLVLPCSQTRDSGTLDRSNFACALNELGGESDDVQVHRFGHWGPGWFELILVRPDSPAAAIAEEIEASLENYPVLSDDHHSELEYTEACENWQRMSIGDRVHACQKFDVCVFAARRDEIPECRTGELVGYLAGDY